MPDQEHGKPVAREPSEFAAVVGQRSWHWFLELRRQLKLDLVIADAADPASPLVADSAASLPSLIEQRDGDLMNAIAIAVQDRGPQLVERAGQQIIVLPLTQAGGRTGGVLAVARVVPKGVAQGTARSQLSLLGTWLRAAVEAHLQSPPTVEASGLDRMAPLARVLERAGQTEPDRELVRLLGQALAVWHDIEVCGYAQTSDDTFSRAAMLPGSRREEWPEAIPANGLPESADLVQLPQGHLDRFGLGADEVVYVSRMEFGTGRAWLIAFTGAIGPLDIERLAAYASLLRMATRLAIATAEATIYRKLARHFLDAGLDPGERAGRAVETLRAMLDATWASLDLDSPVGRLSIDRPEGAGRADAQRRGDSMLGLEKRSERHYTTSVSVGRRSRTPFTPWDEAVAAAGLEAFDTHGRAVLDRRAPIPDRRVAGETFSTVVGRAAREAVAGGAAVSLVVLRGRAGFARDATQASVARLRADTRAADVVGMFAESEIGVLMRDTTIEQARVAAGRFQEIVHATSGSAPTRVGVAARERGQGTVSDLVREARVEAASGEGRE